MRAKWLALGAVAALAALAFLVFGLGGGRSAPAPFAPIAQAAERTAALPGARISGSGTSSANGFQIDMTFDGVIDGETNRSSMKVEASSPQEPQIAAHMGPILALQDGLVIYMASPLFTAQTGKTWMKIDLGEATGVNADAFNAGATDARGTLESLRAVGADARTVGSERVRGVLTTHYAATIDPALEAQQLRDAGAEPAAEIIEQQAGPASVDVWVGQKDGLVHRISENVPFEISEGVPSEMTLTMDFYDFGIQPRIDLPPDDQVFDATDLAEQGVEEELGGS